VREVELSFVGVRELVEVAAADTDVVAAILRMTATKKRRKRLFIV